MLTSLKIIGYKDYAIDRKGNVYSRKVIGSRFGKISPKWRKLKPALDTKGYKYVMLCADKVCKTHRVHRLLALIFMSKPKGKPLVLHKDGDRTNNNLINLYWGTYSENTLDAVRHGTRPVGEKHNFAKLNKQKVKLIRLLVNNFGWTLEKTGNLFGVSLSLIGQIKNKQIWKHIT